MKAPTSHRDVWHLRDFTIRDLHESAETGCHLCRIFLYSLLPPDMIVGNRHGYYDWYDINKDIQIQCTLRKGWDEEAFPIKLKVLPGRRRRRHLGSMLKGRELCFKPVHPTLLESMVLRKGSAYPNCVLRRTAHLAVSKGYGKRVLSVLDLSWALRSPSPAQNVFVCPKAADLYLGGSIRQCYYWRKKHGKDVGRTGANLLQI